MIGPSDVGGKELTMGLAKVVSIARDAEPDGGHVIEVVLASGETIEPLISPDLAVAVVHHLQPGIVERADKHRQTLSLPQSNVHDFGVTHGENSSELTVRTEQMGFVVLQASDETLQQGRREIDRVLSLREARKSKH
jgi:hypothetical protein